MICDDSAPAIAKWAATECRKECSVTLAGSFASALTLRHTFDIDSAAFTASGAKTKASGSPSGWRAIIACAAAGRAMMRGLAVLARLVLARR